MKIKHQNIWDASKAVLSGGNQSIKRLYTSKEKRSQVNDFRSHPKKSRKIEIKPKEAPKP